MQALRIEASGITTSFRYAHFLVGRQPTFRMPPPATIYGLICSAAGDYVDPDGLEFGYRFLYHGVGDDLEQLHLARVAYGKLPGTSYPRNLEATPNPVAREVLMFPELTLYLRTSTRLDDLERAFHQPRFTPVLGRSQDLIAYRRVEVVELTEAEAAYVEWTLLPWSYRSWAPSGVGVTMPRFIDPVDRRHVLWSPFVVLEGRVVWRRSSLAHGVEGRASTTPAPGLHLWVDPESPEYQGLRRAVVWHDFRGAASGAPTFITPAE